MAPITLPQVARYKTIVGLTHLPGNVGQIQNIFAVDDNSFAVFRWDSGVQTPNYSWECFVIDVPTLAITHYASTGMSGNLQSAPLVFGPGNFLLIWNDGTSYNFSVRNLKLNNASPILVPYSTGIISTPCYNQVTKIFYCSGQRLVAVGSYYPNGGAGFGPVFSRNYSITGAGAPLPLGPGGYAGWYTTAPSFDPWNKTGLLLPVSNQQINTNGIDLGFVAGNPTKIARSAYALTSGGGGGTQGCPASVFNGTATPSGDQIVDSLGTAFNTGQLLTFVGFADSNIPGLSGITDGGGVHLFGDGGVWFYIPCQFGTLDAAAITKNYIAGVISFTGMSIGFFQTPASGLYNGAAVTKNKWKLSNYARPISVTGKYKA